MDQEIRRLHAAGLTQAEIGERVGCTQRYVSSRLLAMRLPTSHRPEAMVVFSPETLSYDAWKAIEEDTHDARTDEGKRLNRIARAILEIIDTTGETNARKQKARFIKALREA